MTGVPRTANPTHTPLDMPLDEFRKMLHQAADAAVDLYAGLDRKPVFNFTTPTEARKLFDEPLPTTGSDIPLLLSRVQKDVFGNATLNISPNFYAYVMSGGNQAGIIGELLAVALNQNMGKWHLGVGPTEMERQVIRWIAEFIGYPVETAGVLLTGGSAANLTCLKAARDAKAPFDIKQRGANGGSPMIVYVSREGHSCIDKSMDMLGLGRDNLGKIATHDDFTIDLDALEVQISADKAAGLHPFCIIGNGGTVNTGAVDPLNALADIAQRNDMWFHIDAAYGGPAAATTTVGHLFKGIERADSIALDPHKWLYVPFETGCALVKNGNHLRSSYSVIPEYLRSSTGGEERFDFMEYNFQLSRGFRALKVWMTFKAHGTSLLKTNIEGNIETIRHLVELIDRSDEFERLAPSPLSIVCFRYRTTDKNMHGDEQYLSRLNSHVLEEAERDGRVFLTGTRLNGKTALRVCSVNHRTTATHVEYLLSVLTEIGRRAHTTLQDQQPHRKRETT